MVLGGVASRFGACNRLIAPHLQRQSPAQQRQQRHASTTSSPAAAPCGEPVRHLGILSLQVMRSFRHALVWNGTRNRRLGGGRIGGERFFDGESISKVPHPVLFQKQVPPLCRQQTHQHRRGTGTSNPIFIRQLPPPPLVLKGIYLACLNRWRLLCGPSAYRLGIILVLVPRYISLALQIKSREPLKISNPREHAEGDEVALKDTHG